MDARQSYAIAKARREFNAGPVTVGIGTPKPKDPHSNDTKVALLTGAGIVVGQRLLGATTGKVVHESWEAARRALSRRRAAEAAASAAAAARKTRHAKLIRIRRA